jgi:cysteinyl-tRNA synthetase
VLGLNLKLAKPTTVPDTVKELVKKRENLRQQKEWDKADKIREEITKQGFRVEDTVAGPVIKKLQ